MMGMESQACIVWRGTMQYYGITGELWLQRQRSCPITDCYCCCYYYYYYCCCFLYERERETNIFPTHHAVVDEARSFVHS